MKKITSAIITLGALVVLSGSAEAVIINNGLDTETLDQASVIINNGLDKAILDQSNVIINNGLDEIEPVSSSK